MTNDVVFSQQGCLGIIALNRPKALNALSSKIMGAMSAQLSLWRADENIQAIILQHSGGKAFCAGGDVREVHAAQQANSLFDKIELIRVEYFLDHQIATYPKPIIALIDGITFGGGAGISLHTAFSVATENTLFSMPEARIGLFPDAGVDRLLCGLEGSFGVYLGLTGARLKAADMCAFGLAQYYLEAEQIPEILRKLSASKNINKESINAILQGNIAAEPLDYTEEMKQWIADTFCFKETQQILEKVHLDQDNPALSDSLRSLAKTALEAMEESSPLSLCVTHQLLSRPAMPLRQTLQQNYALVQNCLEGGDFYEGVRALLVDKDRKPNWRYKNVALVDQSVVDGFFNPLLPELDYLVST